MIEELRKAADNLCNSLDKSSENENLFYETIRQQLEYASFQILRTKDCIQTIKEIHEDR